jgi:hypothetical protein
LRTKLRLHFAKTRSTQRKAHENENTGNLCAL